MPILTNALRTELSSALGLKSLRRELRAEMRHLTRAVKSLRSQVRKQAAAANKASRDGRAAIARASRLAAKSAARVAARPGPSKRVLNLSPKRRAALRLQGQYMGALRALTASQKAAVKKVKASKGYEAAIRTARKIAGR